MHAPLLGVRLESERSDAAALNSISHCDAARVAGDEVQRQAR
jgi:hypothetical protein